MPPAVLTNVLRSLTDERSSQGPNNQAFTSALPKNTNLYEALPNQAKPLIDNFIPIEELKQRRLPINNVNRQGT